MQLEMKVNRVCQILCKQDYGQKEVKQFKELIKDEYRVHW